MAARRRPHRDASLHQNAEEGGKKEEKKNAKHCGPMAH